MTPREKCRRLVAKGLTLSEAAQQMGVKPGTVRQWAKRGRWKSVTRFTQENGVESVTLPEPKREIKLHVWMRTLLHTEAHLVGTDGVSACGAKITLGGLWMPAEHTRHCRRCLAHEAGTAGQPQRERNPNHKSTLQRLKDAEKKWGLEYKPKHLKTCGAPKQLRYLEGPK